MVCAVCLAIFLLGKYLSIRIRKFTVSDGRDVSIAPLWRPLCRGCKKISHVLGNNCDIVFISLSQQIVQRVTLPCSCCFIDTVKGILVVVKWNSLWKFPTFSVMLTHATGPSHFVNALQVHWSSWIHSIHPSLVNKWHDRHRYLSIHHVPYLMILGSPRHSRKTLRRYSGTRWHSDSFVFNYDTCGGHFIIFIYVILSVLRFPLVNKTILQPPISSYLHIEIIFTDIYDIVTELIIGLRLANERRRYKARTSLIDWTQA